MANNTGTGGGGHNFQDHYIILLVFFFLFFGFIVRMIYSIRQVEKYVPLPFTVIMLIIGFLFQVWNEYGISGSLETAFSYALHIHPDVILYLFVPALVFESAYAINHHVFKKVAIQSISLASIGVAINIGLVAVFVFYVFNYENFSWWTCLMLGSIVSATDPVAVVALLRDLGVSPRLSTLIEGESLLNDGSAFVCFLLFLDQQTGKNRDAGEMIVFFIRLAGGGPAVGIAMGLGACVLLALVYFDNIVETTIIVILPFAAFWVCEVECHVSGVLGVVLAGLVVGYFGKPLISSIRVEEQIHFIWQIISWWLNVLLFAISGIILADRFISNGDFTVHDYLNGFYLYLWIHVTRFVSIVLQYPLLEYFGYHLSLGDYCVLTYGGLRGAIALALALIVEAEQFKIQKDVRDRIVLLVSAVVFLTLIINGTTTRFILQFFGMGKVSPARSELINLTTEHIKHFTLNSMKAMQQNAFYQGADWNKVEKNLMLRKFDLKKKEKSDLTFCSGGGQNGTSFTMLATAGYLTSLGGQPGILTELVESRMERYELRKVFLQALKLRYRHYYYEERAMGAFSYMDLTESIETQLDNDTCYDLNGHWEDISSWFSLPHIFEYGLFKLKFAYLNDLIIHRWISRGYEIGNVFIQANRDIVSLLTDVRPSVGGPLLKQIHTSIERAHEALVTITAYSEELTSVVQTRHASFNLIKTMLEHTEHAYEDGILDESEYSKLEKILHERIRSISMRHFQLEKAFTSDSEVLYSRAYLKEVARVYDLFDLGSKKKTFNAGTRFISFEKTEMEKGEESKANMYILLRGQVVHKYKEFSAVDSFDRTYFQINEDDVHIRAINESKGSVLGTMESVVGVKWEEACALSYTEVLIIDKATFSKIECDHEIVANSFYKMIASQLLSHHFRRIAFKTHPTGLIEALLEADILKGSQRDLIELLPYQVLTCAVLVRGTLTIFNGIEKQGEMKAPAYFEGKCTVSELSPDGILIPLDTVEKHRNRITTNATNFHMSETSDGLKMASRSSLASTRLRARHSVATTMNKGGSRSSLSGAARGSIGRYSSNMGDRELGSSVALNLEQSHDIEMQDVKKSSFKRRNSTGGTFLK